LRNNCEVRELLEKKWISEFQEDRDEIRDRARDNIAKIQEENRRGFNRNRKEASTSRENDLVAIKRTQQEPELKLASTSVPTRLLKSCIIIGTWLGKWVITKVHGKHPLLPIM